ncbi:MAG TPA: response regulator transcription factor [Crinalium sp.]|jgi:DNA-binding NarL/FixJ family response regulator
MLQTFETRHSVSVETLQKQLSNRELEVLKLMVEGYRNSEIAKTLYLSPGTVKTHVRNILGKLGVEHRTQAAVFALRHGLI